MNGVPVARILGFEIRIHLSWIFIIAVISATVGSRMAAVDPATSVPVAWLIGLGSSLGFLVTVIVHELAHAIVARRHGSTQTTLVVQFIGSPALVDVRAATPRAEILTALAGPATSLAFAVVLTGAGLAGLLVPVAAIRSVAEALFIVGVLNAVLGAISLVPAFPLDGGRIVRAIGWSRTGDPRRGARIAAVVGRWIGRLLVVLGLAVILVADSTVDGIMLGLIGWFLGASARSAERWATLDELISGVTVGDAMEERTERLAPQLTLDTFAAGVLDGTVGPALAVVRDDELLGLVGAAQLRRIPRRDWPSTRTEDVMVGRAELPDTGTDESLTDAVERLRTTRLDALPVFDGAAFRGFLTRRSVAAALHRRAEARGVTLS